MIVSEVSSGKRYQESKRIGYEMQDYAREIGSEKLYRDGDALISCGSDAHVYRKEYSSGKVVPSIVRFTCKSRACPPCNALRLREYRKMIETIIDERGAENFIFLTVTTRGRVAIDGVRGQFDYLSKELSGFFRTAIIKASVVGGFRSLEGNSDSEGMINPHSHILLETNGADLSENKAVLRFLKSPAYQDRLKDYLKNNPLKTKEQIVRSTLTYLKNGRFPQLVWSALLYDRGLGAICDVQEVSKFKSPGKSTCDELLKYMTKSMKLDGAKLPQFILAMKGKRSISSWGSLKMNKSDLEKMAINCVDGDVDAETEGEDFTLTYVGTLREVTERAVNEGDSFCQLALGLAVRENIITVELDDG